MPRPRKLRAGLRQQRRRQQQRHLHDDRLQRVRQHVLPQDMPGRCAETPGGVDIELLPHDQRPGADDSRQRRKHHDADCDHAVGQPDAERAGDGDREHDGREREERVDDPADDVVGPASEESGREADRQTDGGGDADREQAGINRRRRAVDQPAKMSRPRSSVPSRCCGPARPACC